MATSAQELWQSRLTVPNYGISEAARYADISAGTVGRWQTSMELPDRQPRKRISYYELIEIAVVSVCRQVGMKLVDIKAAHQYFSSQFKTPYPFATLDLKTDGVDLLKDYSPESEGAARMIAGNRNGQLAWRDVIAQRFREFEYERGVVTSWAVAGEKSSVIIDPRVRFGAPAVEGLPTWLIKERWEAGEPPEDTASEFNLKVRSVKDALKFEGIDPKASPPNKWLN